MILYNYMAWVNGEKCLCFISADSRYQADAIIEEMYRDVTAYMFGAGIGDYEDELFRNTEWYDKLGYSTWVSFVLKDVDLPRSGNTTDAYYQEVTMLPYYTREEKIDQLLK